MKNAVLNRKRKVLTMVLIVFFTVMIPLTSYAADAKVLTTNVYNEEIYIFIKGISGLSSDSVIQIGNTVCTSGQISVSSFEQMDSFMRTLILVDNSKSIPEKNHTDIQEILKGIVSNSKENEQIKIGTFSREAVYLCDYTSDHAILENIIDSITYKDQDTYLSDVLYNMISVLKSENTFVCTRIIILSDGADDNYIGYPNDEVRRYIESNQYPIYTIGIHKKNNASQLETMFSFSRAAKADYFLMDGSITNEDIVNALLTDQKGICLKITPDERLKDGSNKSILLKLNTEEGIVELKTNADMPFGKIDENPTESETTIEPETESESEESLPVIHPTSESETVSRGNESKDKGSLDLLWIIILLAVVIVVLIIVLVILILAKKKKTSVSSEPDPSPVPVIDNDDTDTRLGGNHGFNSDPEKELWGKKYLILRNLDVPNIFFKVPIVETVHIGRRSTQDIILDDPEASREHCEITIRSGLMYLKNCSKSNGTYYENALVHEGDEIPIVNGGRIKMGQYQYSIELVDD